jgi:phage gp29-like protein
MTFLGVPDWRRDAGPGVALATVAPKPAVEAPPGTMEQVIMPGVRDRWLASQIYYYTPRYVENIIRGAAAGYLLGRWLMFDLMERTWPRLNKNLNELKNAAIDLDWNVQPYAPKGDKPTPEAQKRAKVVEQLLYGMKPDIEANEEDFEGTLYDSMDAVGKGLSVQEILWMAPDDPNNATGLWAPRATRWVHPKYYGYPITPGSQDRVMLNAMEVNLANPQANLSSDQIYARFPQDQFIVSIVKQKSGHPINGAMLNILGFIWASQNFAWQWFLNLAQIFGVPIRWATYSTKANLATINAVEQMLGNMGTAGWAAFPEGTKLEIFKALESARDNPSKSYIDACDQICDILILGQTLTSTQGERGSQSLGNIHNLVRNEKIQAVAKHEAKTLNLTLLPALCRLNFGDDQQCPFLRPTSKESKDMVQTATRWKTILSSPGVKVSAQQFYEENELVIPEAQEDTLLGQAGAPGGGPPGAGGAGAGGQDAGDETPSTALGRGSPGGRPQFTAQAADAATEKVISHALENLTGVQDKWLAGVKPFFRDLVAKAKDAELSDADFVKALERASKHMPELFAKLDSQALAKALEDAMGAALVNGAVRGSWRIGAEGGKSEGLRLKAKTDQVGKEVGV